MFVGENFKLQVYNYDNYIFLNKIEVCSLVLVLFFV